MKNPETGKRVSRINPKEEWIVTEVPELRIVDDALWQAVKERQEELTQKYATVIEATQTARANRLNGTHRPRHLLSGLLECGACGGPYSMRGQDRYGCSNHVMNDSCSNGRGIRRTELEERVLVGLKDHLMAPEAADAAVRAWAEETNRLNRERSASSVAERKELADIEKKIDGIVVRHPGRGLQPRAQGTAAQARSSKGRADEDRLATVPAEIPDIHPNVAGIYRRKVARLAKALSQTGGARCGRGCDPGIDRRDRADARRKARRTPGHAARRARQDSGVDGKRGRKGKDRHALSSGMSVSVVAGVGFEPTTFRL